MTHTLQIDRSDIADVRWHETEQPTLEPGQVRLEVEHFGLSANNVTYAVIGESMGYWKFFPTDDPTTGCVPVWGYARVVESRCDEVAIDRRVYGYLPFATDVVVTPTRVRDHGFVEGSAHRADLPAAYNSYVLLAEEPSSTDVDREAYEMLLRPLFMTSQLIADWLAEQDFFGAETILVSSASSKTGYGTAYALKHLADGDARRPEVVGLTSPERVADTAALDLYDRVLGYGEITSLDAERPTVYVDMSGSTEIRAAVHHHCTGLRHDCAVGLTHRDDFGGGSADGGGGADPLPGPRPELFFAPSELARQAAAIGRAEHARRLDEAMAGFAGRVSDSSDPLMTLEWVQGREAAAAAWLDVVAGRTDPGRGTAVTL